MKMLADPKPCKEPRCGRLAYELSADGAACEHCRIDEIPYSPTPDEPVAKSTKKRLCVQDTTSRKKAKPTTLPAHTDGRTSENRRIAEALGHDAQVVQGALHLVPSVFVAGMIQAPPTDTPYRKLDNPEQYQMRRVKVPAGALVLWGSWTVHTNEHPEASDPLLKDCEHDVTVTSVAELKAMLALRGVAVWPNVLDDAEQRQMVQGMVDDLVSVAPEGTPVTELNPPGSIGCMIVKCYGLGGTINAQKRRLNTKVRGIFAGLFGVDPMDLTQSADAFSWVPPKTIDGPPLRAAQFISWAPWAAMDLKEVPKKIRAMQAGKSMCHDPLRFRSGGGPGHMANPKAPHPKHWCTHAHPFITPGQLQALGAR